MNAHRYVDDAALRVALDERLRRRAQDAGVPLDRLRKEVAHQRLLARLAAAAPPGTWALKGGMALLARLDDAARATKDADATWRAPLDTFGEVIEATAETDLGDGFMFEVAAPRPLMAETDEGGVRYPVLARLDGREFERLQLDVNAVPGDPRPIEYLRPRDLFDFAGIPAPIVPVISPSQHLAEKLHAFARSYSTGDSDRPRDLFDMLVIAQSIPLPDAGALVDACRLTFALRGTDWPPALPSPPPGWTAQWTNFFFDHTLPWRDLEAASTALTAFWQPLLTADLPANSTWDADHWRWMRRPGGLIVPPCEPGAGSHPG